MTDEREDDRGDKALEKHALAILGAIRNAGIGVCVTVEVDGQQQKVIVNDAAVKILGHSREALLTRPAMEVIALEEHARLQEILQQRMGGERNDPLVETVIRRADGTTFPITYAIVNIEIDGRLARLSLFWDISARRRAEDALMAEEARLRQLILAAPDGIVISRQGVVLEANPAAAMMLGFDSHANMSGTSLHSLMSPVDAATMKERVAAKTEGKALAPHVYEARRQDGSRVIAEITSVPYEHEGQPAILGFARDITERARLQAQLAQNERLAALGTLAAGVAHEINNPLTVMTLGIEALSARLSKAKDRLPDDAQSEMNEILGELRTGVDRVAGIVRELKAFSRADDEVPGPTDLAAVLATAERMSAHHVRHKARVCAEYGAVPKVLGDQRRLEQVFVNLLVNAAQALPDGRSANRIDLRIHKLEDGLVAVDVKDNGPGIEPDVLKRIFEPFFTTKAMGEGTGLGLAISHEIVKRFGGEIRVESDVGSGTTVRVVLKEASPNEEDASPSTRAATLRSRIPARARVLIVDDEVSLTSSLRMLLDHDHDVTTVTAGEAACGLLLHGPSFDLVLCDIMMPGVSGMDLHARVAASRPELLGRIVFMTGGACTPDAAAFLAAIPNRVLQKPFGLSEIQEIIREARTA